MSTSTNDKKRWLQVAKRASEFRSLIGSGEVAEAARLTREAEAALHDSERMALQAQSDWRDHLARPQFHAAEETQHRLYHGSLRKSEAERLAQAEEVRRQLADAQTTLKRELAEKNALQAAIDHSAGRLRVEQAQVHQRDTDEVWAITQRHEEGTP